MRRAGSAVPTGDHPRSRGVYPLITTAAAAAAGSSPLARGLLPGRLTPSHGAHGSSPLARGLHDFGEPVLRLGGIIPARAGFTAPAATAGAPPPDHPRSRGVYRAQQGHGRHDPGSSPLARGLPGAGRGAGGRRRIIPARAGFTAGRTRTAGLPGDHPRSRGVYFSPDGGGAIRMGSSPLARGLPARPGRRAHPPGIIPARAGFTPPALRRQGSQQDHPRSRGVYTRDWIVRVTNDGSSPLARGLLFGRAGRYGEGRIIPARAGFTAMSTRPLRPGRDHPRSRGVYGSRPASLMRPTGIIPARAGFTGATPPTCARRRDHPRSRGVYASRSAGLSAHQGSSPLARGLQAWTARQRAVLGIIPARAGFTRPRGPSARGARDHPRSRGVYPMCTLAPGRPAGSSPLARGLLLPAHRLGAHPRIIPARAGFTTRMAAAWRASMDHPRSRGVYRGGCSRALSRLGSSPLARGLLRLEIVYGWYVGSSPLARGLRALRI